MSFPRYPAYKDSGVEWLGEIPEHWGSPKDFFHEYLAAATRPCRWPGRNER